jgi:hypothetical protein
MAQNQNRFVCEGCGRQFHNRQELEQHWTECPAVRAQQQSRAGGRTRAMGGASAVEDIVDEW